MNENGEKGFYSTFSHNKENASPGYYEVNIDSYNIEAKLTASERVGFHQYTFPASEEAHVILDLVYNVYCLLYTSPSPRDQRGSRMPSSA